METQELKNTLDQLQSAFHEFRTKNDERLAEIAKNGKADAVIEEHVNKLNNRIEELQGRVTEAEKASYRTGNGGDETTQKSADMIAYEKGFDRWFRKGEEGNLRDLEAKALSVNSDPDGGYTVTPEQGRVIMGKIFETSPMRQVATVTTINSDAIEHLVDKDEATGGGWVSEEGSRSETTTPQFAKIRIPVHEQYEAPRATQKLLDDSAFSIESWLAAKVADKMARRENEAFVTGNGVGRPRGFTTYASGTSWGQIERVNSGAAAALTADGLISLLYSLKPGYRTGATWAMNRSTVSAVRKLKDSQNQYLWAPGLAAGQPSILLGFPIVEFEDMADVAANSLSVAFANFRVGYEIVDRQGVRVLRDPYSNKPYVEFYTTRRVGGDVTVFEAIKLQNTAA